MERIRISPEDLSVSTFETGSDAAGPTAQHAYMAAYSVGCRETDLLCPSSDGRCIFVP